MRERLLGNRGLSPRGSTILAINQARTGSTRLPNKVTMPLLGKPMLAQMMERSLRSKLLDDIVVATTTLETDDVLINLCKQYGWSHARYEDANRQDLLGLYYKTALEYGMPEIIVRITSDNPLIDSTVIDLVIAKFLTLRGSVDYVGNCELPLTYPIGIAVEVFTFDALERSYFEDNNPAWREHVTQYIRRQPDKFRIVPVYNEVNYSSQRWTVDTPEDFAFVEKIYNHFGHNRFHWLEVIKLLEEHPEWLLINQHVQQKAVDIK